MSEGIHNRNKMSKDVTLCLVPQARGITSKATRTLSGFTMTNQTRVKISKHAPRPVSYHEC